MKKTTCLVLCFLLTLGLFSACSKANNDAQANQESSTFSVGFAQGDITPPTGVAISGMGDDDSRFSTGILDPLYATCVAFTDTEGTTVIMFCLDLLNTNVSVCNTTSTMIAEATGVPTSNIVFTASHTHSGPTQKMTQFQTVIESNKKIMDVCLKLAKDALADRKPAQMYTTFARPDGLNYVRHYIMADGTYLGKRLGYVNANDIIGHHHKADNLLQLVKFTREGGKDVILTNWQAHYQGAPSIDYNGISADYPGAYRKALEEALDCHAAFVLGGAGNLVSNSKVPSISNSYDYYEHGKKLADAAVAAAANFKPANVGKIYIEENMYKIPNSTGTVPLYAFGFGDFGCAFAPFEIFDTNAKGVREDSNWKYTFYASCSNGGDSNMYLPDHEGFSFRTYEAYGNKEEDVTYTRYPEGTAEFIQEELTTMLNDLFAQSGNEKQEKDEGYMSVPFEPTSDGLEYTNPTPGDMSKITAVENGIYRLQLMQGLAFRTMLAIDQKTAEEVMQKQTMKLLFDERGVIVGIAE